ncbi:copper transporter [Mycolicibacter senuensis]|uniref:Copper transporter MctB n=1 Tax=Mycolicibacter senuensis TaxID=386913 RepID=A0A7I9XI98_9MYCO|nr:copper transporter [Mycolicibacter senuensis]MDQ2629251.1 copper transporter [Actinomycetota bacterium]ORW70719.1 channel-forming protein [Mycolicibacter senuensis]GFG69712.1 copper transporter MctB [Mycolicibacter senuensis]
MITPRYHAMSLTAVLLALVFGVVLGSGLLSGPLMGGLQSDKQELRAQIDTLHQQQNALGERLSNANEFDAAMAPRIVRDALHGKSAVIFRTPDAVDEDVDAVARIIGQAGGAVTGTVALTTQFVDGNAEEKLRAVMESGIVPAGAQLSSHLIDQGAQAGDLLGIALLINRDPAVVPADDPQRATVLAALRDTGFITYREQRFGPANAAVVVTGGALPEDAGSAGVSVARFAAAVAPHGSATVLAGRDGSASGTAAVAMARADSSVAATVSTVDDVDVESGRITTVMALSSLIEGGDPGQYGIGHGAGSVTIAQ